MLKVQEIKWEFGVCTSSIYWWYGTWTMNITSVKIITHIVIPQFWFDLFFPPPSEMKLHEPKPSGLMANPAFANVVNMNLSKSVKYYKYESWQNWQILQMWILTNLTNITNMNLIKTTFTFTELLLKLLEFKGEEFAVQPGKCLYGHGRGGRWGTSSKIHQKCKI